MKHDFLSMKDLNVNIIITNVYSRNNIIKINWEADEDYSRQLTQELQQNYFFTITVFIYDLF